jgi:hypothetical protein
MCAARGVLRQELQPLTVKTTVTLKHHHFPYISHPINRRTSSVIPDIPTAYCRNDFPWVFSAPL